jgi:SprT-like family
MTPSSFQKRISASASTERDLSNQVEPAGDARDLALFGKAALEGLGLGVLAAKLSVLWNSRMRSTAGLAYPNTSQIVLNPKLRGFGWAEVERTLLHELAHLVAHHRCGRRRISPHGPEWRRAWPTRPVATTCLCPDAKWPAALSTNVLPARPK